MSDVSKLVSNVQKACALALILGALLLNPWIIEDYVVRDGTLEQKNYVLLVNAAMWQASTSCWCTKKTSPFV